MLTELKFVQGAVSKKDYQPALTHFRIRDGRVTGYNGVIALSCPIGIDLDATPKAIPFVKAIERCYSETTAMHLTPNGRLYMKSGAFKAYIPCTDDSEILDGIQPEGDEVEVADNLLDAILAIGPWVGTDASRPWATGLLLRGASAYATNNIIVAEYWLGKNMPEVNLPSSAIAELLRIKQKPISVRMSHNSMTFLFNDGKWMRTQLLSSEWPNIQPILDLPGDPQPLPDGLFAAVETIIPFVGEEGRVYFRGDHIATCHTDDDGASVDLSNLPPTGAFHYEQLMSLEDRITAVDFSTHPKPCPFKGKNLRGVILGMIDA